MVWTASLMSVSESLNVCVNASNSASASAYFRSTVSVSIEVILVSKRRRVTAEPHERLDDRWVVHRSSAALNNLQRRVQRDPPPIRPIGRHRVEAVDNRDDPRAERNADAFEPAQIPCAVPVLVMR